MLKPISHLHNETPKVLVFVLGFFFPIFVHSQSLRSSEEDTDSVTYGSPGTRWEFMAADPAQRQSSSRSGHKSICNLAGPVTNFMAHLLGSHMKYQIFPPSLLLLFLITFITLKGCIQSHKCKCFYFLWLIGPKDSKAVYTSCGFTSLPSSHVS